jgi:hypothetical protein
MSDGRFDAMFASVAQQCEENGIEEMLDGFFGFLSRKTDFYYGGHTKELAEKLVLEKFRKHQAEALSRRQKEVADRIVREQRRKE